METISRHLTIFEGPDGSGKTTAAKKFAEATGARYVHFPAMPRVGKSLARMYVEAMLPALLGYQPVVFDRCWLSEGPYGTVFREGRDRLTRSSRCMLERLALRCGGVVVRCQPEYFVVRANYMKRRHLEMLENEDQLHEVYDMYPYEQTDLELLTYDYTVDHDIEPSDIDALRTRAHRTSIQSAGNWDAEVVLVGQSFAERKDVDPFYQAPFVSFSNEGCSQWLTHQLNTAGVSEMELLWINADQDLSIIHELPRRKVFALGNDAKKALDELKIESVLFPHPQAWRRFNSSLDYPLARYI